MENKKIDQKLEESKKLVEKIKQGMIYSSQKMLEEKKKNDETIVIFKDGRNQEIRARDL